MSLEKVLSLLSSLPKDMENRDAIVQGIKEATQSINQEGGKAKADILDFKKQINDMTDQNKTLEGSVSTYQDFMKSMKDAGIDTVEADKLAKKLKLQKSQDDEIKQLTDLLKEKGAKLKEFETKAQQEAVMAKIEPIFEKARKEFKDKDGKEISIHDEFINKEDLYSNMDIKNEVLVTDKISKALDAAFVKQSEMSKLLLGDKTHLPEVHTDGNRHFSGQQVFDINKSREVMRKALGNTDVVAEQIAQLDTLNDT